MKKVNYNGPLDYTQLVCGIQICLTSSHFTDILYYMLIDLINSLAPGRYGSNYYNNFHW